MKKITILMSALLLAGVVMHGQVLIVRWTFPTGNPSDSVADGGVSANLNKAIHTEGGTSDIDFSKNGATTRSAQATGWDNGALIKCWVVEVTTAGYENLKLSSKQQSGGNNPGPRNYKVQYRIGASGEWTDIPGTDIVTANNWTSGVLDSVDIPAGCSNKTSLFLRWVMTTNTDSEGGTVGPDGIDKIDDIYLTGKLINTGISDTQTPVTFTVSPNPSDGEFIVQSVEPVNKLLLFNTSGKCVFNQSSLNKKNVPVKLDSLKKGTYLLKITTNSGKEVSQKIVIL